MTRYLRLLDNEDGMLLAFAASALLFFGLVITGASLQVADVIPRFTVRPEVFISAHAAVVMLLLGQALLAASWWCYREIRRMLKPVEVEP